MPNKCCEKNDNKKTANDTKSKNTFFFVTTTIVMIVAATTTTLYNHNFDNQLLFVLICERRGRIVTGCRKRVTIGKFL